MRRFVPLVVLFACGQSAETPPVAADPNAEAQAFIEAYVAKCIPLETAASEAEWLANTHIVDGDSSSEDAAKAAEKAFAECAGAVEVIKGAQQILVQKSELKPLVRRQIETILYNAANSPQTIPTEVSRRIDAESQQTKLLYGYTFTLDGREITPNEIDEKLRSSTDLAERRKVWESSKAIGPTLKDGMLKLRGFRNQVVQGLGYHDFYAYQVSDYGMSVEEMDAMMLKLQRELRPLYRELHTWARYELAKKYNQPVPDQLPADWLPNRWGQSWSAMVSVDGVDVDGALKQKRPEDITKMGEEFYVSLGFDSLPPSFWEKSSLYPVAKDAGYKKNTHASAWHIDRDKDVRSLMSIEANTEWYATAHHELGHIYYYQSYSRPEVPILLREGANRAFHEAIGTQIELAALQRPFLQARGLAPEVTLTPEQQKQQEIQMLLATALDQVVFIPFAAGTMMNFERELYVNSLTPDQFNAKWWELAYRYQGIVPPTPRGEQYADALTKTHINDDPAQYYDYALSSFLLFQVHDHIANEILHQDPRATNYFGNKEVGTYLKSILAPGRTVDWQELTRNSTGRDLSADPMVHYFEPLMVWLQEQNKGRTYTLPEL
jgi:peptidyl-dipeptidase A